MPITKKLAKTLEENHEDAERFLRALRPVWEQYKPAERGVPWHLLARRTLLFNDGWGETRVELDDPAPGLLHVTLQHIQRYDDDPSGLARVEREFVLGPSQALDLYAFLKKHRKELEGETVHEPISWPDNYEPSNKGGV